MITRLQFYRTKAVRVFLLGETWSALNAVFMIRKNTTTKSDNLLEGRKLWIPRMSGVGARMAAAAFRSMGIDASATPPSNDDTLELGGLFSSGEECYLFFAHWFAVTFRLSKNTSKGASA